MGVQETNRTASEWLWLPILFLILLLMCLPVADKINKEQPPKDPFVERIEQAEGKPVIIQTVKYGDDEKPKYARTYCQALPFKRYVGDEGIYCWVETMK